MRFAVAALTLLGVTSATKATGDYEQLADTLAAICIHPTSPTDWLAAADARAKLSSWVPDPKRSGARPGPARSVEEQRNPVWQEKGWFLDGERGQDGSDLDIWSAIHAGVPYSSCTVSLPGASSKEMISVLRAKLALGEPAPMFGAGQGWFLAGNPSKPNENATVLTVTEQRIAIGPRIVPSGGGATLPGPETTRTFAGVISFVYSTGAR